jgi:hypothetical protein
MRRARGLAVPVLAAALAVAGCGTTPGRPDPATAVSVMTFNVENLFDTVDAPGKDDKAYLPIEQKSGAQHIAACEAIEVAGWREECLTLDWDDERLERKLAAIAAVIRQVDGGPDIIAFQEVEHGELLDRLRREHLADLGYGPAILIEGGDLRGIDVGFLSKLPVDGTPLLHAMRFPGFPDREGDTRGILEATFVLPDGGRLTGFAVHFPAPFHPVAMRERAYERLSELRDAVPAGHAVFAAGDFNTPGAEAAETGLLESHVRPCWVIGHERGCDGCRGTYYYARDASWSFLDMILFSPARSENATWSVRANSAFVANGLAAQRTPDGTPASFDPDTGGGVSDHWPLVLYIQPK